LPPSSIAENAVKAAGPLKRLISPLVSPPVYDFWVQKLVRNASWATPLATVVERHVEARDAVTFLLRPNGHFAGFQPGQHINVTVPVNGVRHTRSYSLTDVPRKDGLLSITVKRIEGGLVSTELCQHTRVGDVLEIGQAFGEMTVPQDYTGNWLLLAAGSGITPLMSLVRELTQQSLKQHVTLFYWARTRADLCFYQALRDLAAREPRFHLHFVLTREDALLPDDLSERPNMALFEKWVPDFAAQRVYACGPAEFVGNVRELLASRVAYFAAEAFTPPALPEAVVGQVRVQLRESGIEVEVPTDRPLLVALEEAGVKPAYGCRMGICNTCACGKPQGTTQDLLNGELNDEPVLAMKLCVSAARSDLVLDL